jgi:hypothetical protein
MGIDGVARETKQPFMGAGDSRSKGFTLTPGVRETHRQRVLFFQSLSGNVGQRWHMAC